MVADRGTETLGWTAPSFRLKDVSGRSISLDEARGSNGTVVVFLCNHCPYVKAITPRLVRDRELLRADGVEVIAINSNDSAAYPEDSFENMVRFAEDRGFDFPYLHDETQEVARAYGAVCTPDFFGFDRDLRLAYRGRLDEGRTGQPPPNARRELVEAMRQIVRTGRGPEIQNAPVGCSIKWKAA